MASAALCDPPESFTSELSPTSIHFRSVRRRKSCSKQSPENRSIPGRADSGRQNRRDEFANQERIGFRHEVDLHRPEMPGGPGGPRPPTTRFLAEPGRRQGPIESYRAPPKRISRCGRASAADSLSCIGNQGGEAGPVVRYGTSVPRRHQHPDECHHRRHGQKLQHHPRQRTAGLRFFIPEDSAQPSRPTNPATVSVPSRASHRADQVVCPSGSTWALRHAERAFTSRNQSKVT